MNLNYLTAPLPKPDMNLNCHTLNADSITSTSITTGSLEAASLTLDNQTPSTAPSLGETTIFTDSVSRLSSMSAYSTITTYSSNVVPSAVQSLTTPLAAPGQNHLWQMTSSGVLPKGSITIYNPYLNMLLSSGDIVGIAYSTDNGVTWIDATFDVPPASFFIIGFNSISLVALGFAFNECYTSVNGINWTKRANLPTTCISHNIEWFNNLFIAGTSSAQKIMTSPDGITWTLRNSTIQAITLKSSSSRIVAVGSESPFFSYSSDGITWFNTASPSESARALAYSSTLNEFLIIGFTSQTAYSSEDGKVWNSIPGIGPSTNLNNTLFFSTRYNRWYLSKVNSDGNYSLWSSPSSRVPFTATNLDGATNISISYSAGYIPSIDSFFLGTVTAPYFAYSTPRNDLKAVTDNIRVRGFPVSLSSYSLPADGAAVTNTTTETPISVNGIGSMALSDSQALGCTLEIRLRLLVTSAGGDTLTIRIKNGVTVYSTNIVTVPAASTNVPIKFESLVTIQATTIRFNNETLINTTPALTTGTAAYTRTIANTFSLTIQWGANASSATPTQLLIRPSFLNGA